MFIKLRRYILYSVLLWMVCSTSVSYSNSGPISIEGDPGSEVLLFQDSTIGVQEETLTIKLSDEDPRQAAIQAVYELKGDDTSTETIQVLFPLKTTLAALQSPPIVTYNQLPIPFEIVSGSLTDDQQAFKISNAELNRPIYKYVFNDASKILFKPHAKQSVLLDGNQMSVNANDTIIELTDINPNCVLYAYDSPIEFIESTAPLKMEILTSEDFIKTLFPDQKMPSMSLIYENWQSLSTTTPIALLSEIQAITYESRWYGFVYKIPATSGIMSVSYTTDLSIDRENSHHYIYQLNYLLSPAKKWAFFKKLNLQIDTNENSPYVLSSNLPVVQSSTTANHYEGTFNNVPADEWLLSFYEKPTIGFVERHFASFLRKLPYLLFFLLPFIFTISIIIAIILVFKLFKKIILGNK